MRTDEILKVCDMHDDLMAEIERLKEHVASTEGAMQEMIQVAANADAEIDRLRAALNDCLRMLEAVRYTTGLGKKQMERIAKARALLPPHEPSGAA